MSSQIENAKGLVKGLAAQAVNRAPGNQLHTALTGKGSPLERLEARTVLGQPMDEAELPGFYASLSSAIDTHNAAVVINKPTLEEVVAIIGSAEED